MIRGATGSSAAYVNGRFELAEREVYRKVGEPDSWLFVVSDGCWWVGPTASKDARKTESTGWAHTVASAGGLPPPAGAGQWQLYEGSDWVPQTVQVDQFR